MKVAFYSTYPYDLQYFQGNPQATGLSFVFHPFHLTAATAASAQGCQAVCAFVSDTLDADCLAQLHAAGVRHVALRCAGFNNIDMAAATRLGITASRVPAYSPHAVAEHAIALLMTLNRKTHRAHARVRENNFSLSGLVGFDIYGRTVGILGTGKIGRITAEIFRGFGARLRLYDAYPDTAWAQSLGATYGTLDEVLAASDIVSLHTPLTPQTHHLINSKTLAQMKKGAYLINTSRGKLIDTAALIQALKDDHLGGVCLDVYEEEAGIFFEDLSGDILHDDVLSRLLTFPNVLITAHQAFLTDDALAQIASVTLQNLSRVATGAQLLPDTQVVAVVA